MIPNILTNHHKLRKLVASSSSIEDPINISFDPGANSTRPDAPKYQAADGAKVNAVSTRTTSPPPPEDAYSSNQRGML